MASHAPSSDRPSDLQECARCGRIHGRRPNRARHDASLLPTCTAHKRKTTPLEPCMTFPKEGFKVCDLHGGKTPLGIAGAEERNQVAAVRAAVVRYALPVDRPPAEGIRLQLAQRAGEVEWLRGQVQALDPDGMWRGTRGLVRTEKTGFQAGVTTATDVGPVLPIVWEEYLKAQTRYEELCIAAVKLGFTWEQIKLDRMFGERVAKAFTYLFASIRPALGPSESAVHQQFAETLQLLASGGEFPVVKGLGT